MFVRPALALIVDMNAPAADLPSLIRHPFLVGTLYSWPVTGVVNADGAVSVNRDGKLRFVEEQRQGGEWITRGLVSLKATWIDYGWLQLNWGVDRQLPDGSFGEEDVYHSTSLFIEALARACILDPEAATEKHRRCLAAGTAWLLEPERAARYQPVLDAFFHRRFILASLLGEAGQVLDDASVGAAAIVYAADAFAAQTSDGVNPEVGGYDINYQLAGCLFALRYLATNPVADMRTGTRVLVSRALDNALRLQLPDGTFDTRGSLRTGVELGRTGTVKGVNYPEVIQTLVYASVLLDRPELLDNARRIVDRPNS